MVLGLEDEDLAVGGEDRGEQVQGVGGGAGEDDLVAGAAVEELGDGGAALLEQVGGQLREVSGAAVDAAVVGGVRGHVVPDALEGGGAGGVVEGGVGDLSAGDERDGDVAAEDGEGLGAGGVLGGGGGGGVQGCGHGGISRQAGLNGFGVPVRGCGGAAVRGTGGASDGRSRYAEVTLVRGVKKGRIRPIAFACSRNSLLERPGPLVSRDPRLPQALLPTTWSSPGAPRHGRRVAGQQAGA